MRLIILAGISALLVACADGALTAPASPPSDRAPGVVSGLSATAAAASATYDFFNCVGPSGTPSSFSATKTALPPPALFDVSAAGAFHLTDGSAVFVVLSFGPGNFSPPGITHSGNATVSCEVTIGATTFTFSGLLAPAR